MEFTNKRERLNACYIIAAGLGTLGILERVTELENCMLIRIDP